MPDERQVAQDEEKKTYSLFIGRWQPFHDGHKAMIDLVINEGKSVCIALRDTRKDASNPFSVEERIEMIRKVYPDEDTVKIIVIPDISEVCYGRKVGYGIREIRLGEELETISGTKIREKMGL